MGLPTHVVIGGRAWHVEPARRWPNICWLTSTTWPGPVLVYETTKGSWEVTGCAELFARDVRRALAG